MSMFEDATPASHPTVKARRLCLVAALAVSLVLVATASLVSGTTQAGAADSMGWRIAQRYPGNGVDQVYNVSCPSVSHCVAVGADGAVIVSNNGGTSWTTVNSLPDVLSGISCPTTARCVAVGGFSILTSINGGISWTKRSQPSKLPMSLNDIACASANACVAVGDNGVGLDSGT
jgi:hypothetical protein